MKSFSGVTSAIGALGLGQGTFMKMFADEGLSTFVGAGVLINVAAI